MAARRARSFAAAAMALWATAAFASGQPLPDHCKDNKPPVESPEAAACLATAHLGQAQINDGPYQYEAHERDDAWQVTIWPAAPNRLGGGWMIEISKRTGAVLGVRVYQ
jgi:hypothetical protein